MNESWCVRVLQWMTSSSLVPRVDRVLSSELLADGCWRVRSGVNSGCMQCDMPVSPMATVHSLAVVHTRPVEWLSTIRRYHVFDHLEGCTSTCPCVPSAPDIPEGGGEAGCMPSRS